MRRGQDHRALLAKVRADIEGTHCLDDTKRRDLLVKADEMHIKLWLDWVFYRRAVTVAEDATTPPSDSEP